MDAMIFNSETTMEDAARIASKMGLSLFMTNDGKFLAAKRDGKRPEWMPIWVSLKDKS